MQRRRMHQQSKRLREGCMFSFDGVDIPSFLSLLFSFLVSSKYYEIGCICQLQAYVLI